MEHFIWGFSLFRGRGEVSEDACILDHFCPVPVGEFGGKEECCGSVIQSSVEAFCCTIGGWVTWDCEVEGNSFLFTPVFESCANVLRSIVTEDGP